MMRKKRGFTLLELMIATAIMVVALTGILATYIGCLELTETTRNSNLAINAAQVVLEEIRTATFSTINATYNGFNFSVVGMSTNESLGRVIVDSSNSSLLNVSVVVCWRQKAGRIIGECVVSGSALNFSDVNSNGVYDSPIRLSTLVSQR